MTILEAALDYARRGWPVFPCQPRSKIPYPDTHGVKDATTDEATIRAWWTRWPNANVALACGCGETPIYVIDVDKNDQKGIDGWKSLDEFQPVPETLVQLTPRGGAHYLYTSATPVLNKNAFRDGIDIRSKGYYIMLAPSIHPNGKEYRWANPGCALAEFPDSIRPKKEPRPWENGKTTAPTIKKPKPVPHNDATDRARAYLSECEPAIQGMGGHDKLLWAARAMAVGFDLDDGTAISLLWEEYNPRCSPPWDRAKPSDVKDFERKVREARKTPGKPAGWLLEELGLGRNDTDTRHGAEIAADLLASGAEPEQEEADGGDQPAEYEADLPDEMFCPPGFIREFVRYTVGQAPYPHVALAFGAALSVLSLLAGRKFRTAQGTRPNLYIAVLAESGAGKEFPRGVIDKLAVNAGFASMVGNRFASGEGVEDVLKETPSHLFKIDEVDTLLRPIGQSGEALTENMTAMLLSLFGESGGVHLCRAKAGQSAADRPAITSPNLVLFGTAIPKNFYGALAERVVTSGLLSRFLILDVKRPRIGQDTVESELPESLVDTARRLATFWPDGEGKRGDIATALNPVPVVVPATEDANRYLKSFRAECDSRSMKAVSDGDEIVNAVVVRSFERACKLALLYSVSENYERPEIGVESARWAVKMERFCSGQLLAMYGRYGATSDFEKWCRRIEEILNRYKGKSASRSLLMRKTRFPLKQFNEVIGTLIERGTVVPDAGQTKGRTATVYRLKSGKQ